MIAPCGPWNRHDILPLGQYPGKGQLPRRNPFSACNLTHPLDQLTEFSSWVRIPYGLRAQKLKDANQFAQDAIDKEILGSQVKIDGMGDTLLTPPLAYKADHERKFSDHWASAWSDQRQQDTYAKLENKYMGLPDTSW